MNMKYITVSKASLLAPLENLTNPKAVIVLRCLKEAAIIDQRFSTAVVLRDEERLWTGGKSGINAKARRKP